jgi:hypothetical protein
MKSGDKEIGPASVYAEPHTMDGKKMKISSNPGKEPNTSKLDSLDISLGGLSKSAGDEGIKTTGIKTRGNGCATKGTMARGPMA